VPRWSFNARLKAVFAAVAPEPKVLRNSTNCPLYLLCFAVGNQAGAPIACGSQITFSGWCSDGPRIRH